MAEAKKQNFMHGAAILAAGVVVMKLLGAIYKIPLQNILGDVGYGYFFAAYSIYNVLLTISTAGLPVALSRMISEANTLGRPRQARRIFHIAMVTLTVLGAVFSLGMFLFPTELADALVSKPAVSQCVWALSPAVLLVCLTSAFRGYIQGHGNMKPTTIGQVLEVLVKVVVGLALAIFFTRRHESLSVSSAGAIFGVTAGAFAALLYMLWCYLRQYRKQNLDRCNESADVPEGVGHTLGVFVRIGFVITLGASVMSLFTLIDTKLIESTLPHVPGIGPAMADELWGSYSAMQTLYNLPASFITPMTIALVPAIAAAHARRAGQELSSIAESGLRISAVVAMPMGVGLSVLSAAIVGVIYPNTHAMGPSILSWFGVAAIFVCITLVTNAILQAGGDEILPIISMIVGGVIKIACNLLLVRRPEINILGGSMGTVACYTATCLLNCFFIWRRLPVKPNYVRAFLRPLISSAAMGATAWAVYGLAARLAHIVPDSARMLKLLVLAVAIGVAALVYLVMVILTKSVTLEDLKLLPKGEKIAKLLHIR